VLAVFVVLVPVANIVTTEPPETPVPSTTAPEEVPAIFEIDVPTSQRTNSTAWDESSDAMKTRHRRNEQHFIRKPLE
jgi:hypothetical protein